ncbi:MAG TPA: PhzF family phenazine biosynthesis protein [Pseudonocardiaceae bacterium]|nr:PhzF family phenazine biosynthesis protein [Pseudonocardiaceae bacterium]
MVIVRACLREGTGGSPTAVLLDAPMSEAERRQVPVRLGTSHAVFVAEHDDLVSLRFFTSTGELAACGHGTIAALAFLADRAASSDYRVTLRTAKRTFSGWVDHDTAFFDPGPIDLREPTDAQRDLVLPTLDIDPDPGIRVASPGRPRLLVPVGSRSALAALEPDFARLAAACDRAGLLGCYVYSGSADRFAARMFAPAIGVPEDIANANSTACLAAHLGRRITVDMGDSLGHPATIIAGPRQLGGVAEIG